ncbi:MAG: hypothetical protein PHX30_05545 [Candidatus Pacebacteria bacterium]|nr:hypothetical protein [Candidatus Paceibacterota bacterium]
MNIETITKEDYTIQQKQDITKKQKAHIGVVLTVITDRYLCARGFDELYAFLYFIIGTRVSTVQIARALKVCGPYLREQLPSLSSEIEIALNELDEGLKELDGSLLPDKKKNKLGKRICKKWLNKQAMKHGKTFIIKPLPQGAFEVKSQIEDLIGLRKQ